MRISTRLVLAPGDTDDVALAATSLAAELGDSVDLAMLFVSSHLHDDAARIATAVRSALAPRKLLGCTAMGVVADAKEIEKAPAVGLWAASLPGVEIETHHLEYADRDAGGSEGGAFLGIPRAAPDDGAVLILTDPFSFPTDRFLQRMNGDRPGLPFVGGLASGGQAPGLTRLFLEDTVLDRGAVAATLRGPVRIDTVVSQGCRPIGRPFLVTEAERNEIRGLGGKPAIERLVELVSDLDERERALVERGLQIGLVTDEHKVEFDRGDFLIRNIVGIDRLKGSISIGDIVEVGTTVQFHVRDAQTAEEDLTEMLANSSSTNGSIPSGALLFTCNGRGRRFFTRPDHDSGAIGHAYEGLPVAGFFCAGEIGPIGGQNFLHGYTASIGLMSSTEQG